MRNKRMLLYTFLFFCSLFKSSTATRGVSLELFCYTFRDLFTLPSESFLLKNSSEKALRLNILLAVRLVFPLGVSFKQSGSESKDNDLSLIEFRNTEVILETKLEKVKYKFGFLDTCVAREALVRLKNLANLNSNYIINYRLEPLYNYILKSESTSLHYTNSMSFIIKHLNRNSSNNSTLKIAKALKTFLKYEFLPMFQPREERFCKILAKPGVVYEDKILIGAIYHKKALELMQESKFPLTPYQRDIGESKGTDLYYCIWAFSDADLVKKDYSSLMKAGPNNSFHQLKFWISDKTLVEKMPLLTVPENTIVCWFLKFSRKDMDSLIEKMKIGDDKQYEKVEEAVKDKELNYILAPLKRHLELKFNRNPRF